MQNGTTLSSPSPLNSVWDAASPYILSPAPAGPSQTQVIIKPFVGEAKATINEQNWV